MRMALRLAHGHSPEAGFNARTAPPARVLQRHRAGDLQHGRDRDLRHYRLHGGGPGQRRPGSGAGRGALFALAGALTYSELGINFPSSGGEYVYLTHAYGPEWGFIRLGLVFRRFFRAYRRHGPGIFRLPGNFSPSLKPANAAVRRFRRLAALGAAQLPALPDCGFTVLNCFGLGRTAKVQNVLTATKLVVIAGFLVLGFA